MNSPTITPHSVRFIASGRGKSRCAPNPAYPHGVDVNVAKGGFPSCVIDLPYPAPECGHFQIHCKMCGMSAAVTAAGRPDDPRSVVVPCVSGVRN